MVGDYIKIVILKGVIQIGKCISYKCAVREWNGRDEKGDFYFCKECGTEVGRGQEECLLDKFAKEVRSGEQ
jgi:hypothetical protein